MYDLSYLINWLNVPPPNKAPKAKHINWKHKSFDSYNKQLNETSKTQEIGDFLVKGRDGK